MERTIATKSMVPFSMKIVAWWMRIIGFFTFLWSLGKAIDKEFDFIFFSCAIVTVLLFTFSHYLINRRKWAWIGSILVFSPVIFVMYIIGIFILFCILFELLATLNSARVRVSCDFEEFLIPFIPSFFFLIPFLLLIKERRYYLKEEISQILASAIWKRKLIYFLTLGLTVLGELFLSMILFEGAITAFDVYQKFKIGAGTLSFLEFGGSPLLWSITLCFLGIGILIILFGFLRKKFWAWICSLIVAISFPILLSFLAGPPMSPAASYIFGIIFLGGIIFSFAWIILLCCFYVIFLKKHRSKSH